MKIITDLLVDNGDDIILTDDIDSETLPFNSIVPSELVHPEIIIPETRVIKLMFLIIPIVVVLLITFNSPLTKV